MKKICLIALKINHFGMVFGAKLVFKIIPILIYN